MPRLFGSPHTSVSPARAGRAGLRKHLALPVLLLAACATVNPLEAFTMAEINCKIERRALDSGLELSGVVWSDTKAAGKYSLFVRKEGSSGRSSVTQQGLFSVRPEEPSVLGTVMLNAVRGDTYRAELTITTEDNQTCTARI